MGKVSYILEQNKDYILRSYQEGKSASGLAKEFDCNGGSIWTFVKKHGLETHKICDLDSQLDKIKELYSQDVSAYQISKDLGIPLTSLARKMKKLGLDISKRSKIRKDPMKDHEQEVIELYLSGNSEAEISRKFECDDSTICRILKKYNIDTGYPYGVDHSFFDKIDNEVKAYVLGFFTADGCNHKNSTISFASVDLEILEKIKSAMKYTGPIYEKPAPKKFPHRKISYVLSIYSKSLSERLCGLGGCEQRKSFKTFFPLEKELSTELVHHYVRGLFDGDGSIYINKNDIYHITYAGTHKILEQIKEKINSTLEIDGGLYPHGNIYVLKYQSTTKSILAGGWMYSNATIFLDRKHSLYQHMLHGVSYL